MSLQGTATLSPKPNAGLIMRWARLTASNKPLDSQGVGSGTNLNNKPQLHLSGITIRKGEFVQVLLLRPSFHWKRKAEAGGKRSPRLSAEAQLNSRRAANMLPNQAATSPRRNWSPITTCGAAQSRDKKSKSCLRDPSHSLGLHFYHPRDATSSNLITTYRTIIIATPNLSSGEL